MRKTSVFRIVGHYNIAVDFLLRQFLYNQKQNFPASKKAAKIAKISKKGLIMIVEFSVENYRSFRDKAILNFAVCDGKDQESPNSKSTIKTEDVDVPNLVRSIVVYGPNASGKSIFVESLYVLKIILTQTFSQFNLLKSVYHPFLLDDCSKNKPTIFKIVLFIENRLYEYSFSYNADTIFEEILFCDGELIFSRKLKNSLKPEQGHEWFLTPLILNSCSEHPETFKLPFKEKFLFLYLAKFDLKCFYFDKIYEYLENFNNPFFSENSYISLKILDNIKHGDLPKSFSKLLKALGEPCENCENYVMDNQLLEYYQEPYQLSKGFCLLSRYISFIINALNNGGVFLLDEIDQSIHPKVLEYLFFLFKDPDINKKGAQILATCNNTNLMSSMYINPDNIWFIQKNDQFSSVLYPLTDFDIKDDEDIERCYLAGHYNALPYVNYYGCFNN